MRISKKMGLFIASMILVANPLYASTLKSLNQEGTTLVPFRVIAETLGAQVNFDSPTGSVTLSYGEKIVIMQVGSNIAEVNGQKQQLQIKPEVVQGTTYVPVRFIGEALGAQIDYNKGTLKVSLDGKEKLWQLETIQGNQPQKSSGDAFKNTSKTVLGKNVTMVTINMNDPTVKVNIATAGNKVTQAQDLKSMASGAKASVNGTYFAAYNGAVPLPDGTLVKNEKVLHITDIGSTIGFTSDNKVLIDFVKTRAIGSINGEEAWTSYRVNRPTPDTSTVIIYTPEHEKNIPLLEGWVGVVCIDGKVAKKVTQPRTVPNNGFILVMDEGKSEKFQIGDAVTYKVQYAPENTTQEEWDKVIHALSAGPSLMINGKITGSPSDESFTEAKILTQVARRSFIGTTKDNQLMIGTVSASISELKNIVKALGLTQAMCLDGGASSGLYYNGSYLSSPGRQISNSINFYYKQ